jgi:Ion transport protein
VNVRVFAFNHCRCVSGPEWYSDPADTLWFVLESAVVGIFTVEFLIRLATTPSYLGFAKNIMNWIDFLAIAPYYIELMVDGGTGPFSAVRVVRLTRVFRIFKLGRYSADFKVHHCLCFLHIVSLSLSLSLSLCFCVCVSCLCV